MNILEKLKNVPEGTKLYSPMFKDPLEFIGIDNYCEFYPIITKTNVGERVSFTAEGFPLANTAPQNCMIFPTPEMTWEDWEYTPKFKKGDIIASECTIAIIDHIKDLDSQKDVIYYQVCVDCLGELQFGVDCGVGTVKTNQLATNSEKARILKMLSDAGYEFDGVNVKLKKYEFTPFEKVLVRDNNNHEWKCDFFSHIMKNWAFPFRCVGHYFKQCIPYNEETAHLVGTSLTPPKKYITWE